MSDVVVAERRILPSKKVNAGVCSKEERGNELYPTPESLTRALVRSGESLPPLIWEPACGLGHMVRPLVAAGHQVYASDLYTYGWPGQMEIIDFLATTEAPRFSYGGARPTCIITNPPFSLAADFVRHGLQLCQKVCVLGRLAFLEGRGRSDIIDRHLVRVYPLIERPPMMHRWLRGVWELRKGEREPVLVHDDGVWREWSGKKAGSAMPMAWFIFERHDGLEPTKPVSLKRISWRRVA